MDVNAILFAANIGIFVMCGAMFPIMPWITRKSYLFGVKIPPDEQHSPEARQLKNRFRIRCLVGMAILLALCIVQFIVFKEWTLLATLYLPLLIVPVFLAAFIPNWKAATRLKAERGWQVSDIVFTNTRPANVRGSLTALPWGWYLAGFAVIFASILAANFRYYALPEMIPTRFDTNMQPVAWANKTWPMVLLMPLINLGMLLLMIPVAVLIERVKLQIDPATPKTSFAQHRVYRRRMGHALGFLTLMIILFIALIGLVVLFPDSTALTSPVIFWGGLAAVFIPVVILVAVLVMSGQGGCKIKIELPEDEMGDDGEAADNTDKTDCDDDADNTHPSCPYYSDDKYWRLGVFYHNPDDPSYFVEYRFGSGYSLNYAHLPAKIGAALLVVGLVSMYVWVTIMVFGYWL